MRTLAQWFAQCASIKPQSHWPYDLLVTIYNCLRPHKSPSVCNSLTIVIQLVVESRGQSLWVFRSRQWSWGGSQVFEHVQNPVPTKIESWRSYISHHLSYIDLLLSYDSCTSIIHSLDKLWDFFCKITTDWSCIVVRQSYDRRTTV